MQQWTALLVILRCQCILCYREAQVQTGCRMQIVPLETALRRGPKGSQPGLQPGERQPVCFISPSSSFCTHAFGIHALSAAAWQAYVALCALRSQGHALIRMFVGMQLSGKEVVLELAAGTVDSLAAGVQTAFEAIVGNPRYVPFVPKTPAELARQPGSNKGSGADSPHAGVARAA